MKINLLRLNVLLVLFLASSATAQKSHYNIKKGYAAEGYDVVAYFDDSPKEGDARFSAEHDGVTFKFSTKENLDKFNASPESYIPQYGGYCAYAIGTSGKKVSVNPETFEIRDGKLYLFYNSGKNNTLEFWLRDSPETLIPKANLNWIRITQIK